MTLTYPFTEQEMQTAADEWGANCGPSALAFALQIPLSEVRGKIPGFEEKRYTSPTMMAAALENLGRPFVRVVGTKTHAFKADMFSATPALVRVQWCGPWTKEGANPKWAYQQTHWVATWATFEEVAPVAGMRTRQVGVWVFDCNGGIRSFASWEKEIVPLLTAQYPRADGKWFATHIWRVG